MEKFNGGAISTYLVESFDTDSFEGRRPAKELEYPAVLRPLVPEIRTFSQFNHDKLVTPILQYV